MKARTIVAVALATAVAVAAATAAGGTARTASTSRAAAGGITVWLQNDAQKGWPEVVAAATRAFQKKHPGVSVDVQYQTWGDHLTKFDASLAGGNAPDVIEMGNTETFKYMAARALAPLNAKKYPNSKTWLAALKTSCTFGGKLFCVPYYAGARAVIYRKDYYRKAGIKGTPRSLAAFVAGGKKLMKKYGKDRDFSAMYFPGRNWYASMAFVYDYGGAIARLKKGRWQGTLDSPQAIHGLTVLKSVVFSLSRAPKTVDEAHPYPSIPMARGKVASFIGNGWEWPYTLDPKVGDPKLASVMGAYPMPSHIKGRYMPTVLGGSDLAIPVTSKNKALAADWISAFTSSSSMRQLAKASNIPNTTSLLPATKSIPTLAPFAEAAKFSWGVPTSPNWVNVENGNVIENMTVAIFTNRSSVKAAARRASAQITKILNAKS